MTMVKNVLSCILVFVILMSVVPVSVFAVNDGKSTDFASLAENKITKILDINTDRVAITGYWTPHIKGKVTWTNTTAISQDDLDVYCSECSADFNTPPCGVVEPEDAGNYLALGISDSEVYDDNPQVVVEELSSPATSQDWHIEIVDSEGNVGSDLSLALDCKGKPHISYSNNTDGADYNLKYAYYDGTWHNETVDSSGIIAWCTSIALDSQGNPHISYIDRDNYDLKYAYYDGTWHIEIVDTQGLGSSSLALDSQGNPHISYSWGSQLNYTYYDGTWHFVTVDTEGEGSSLALDRAGNPHILYADAVNYDLKYAYYDGTWHFDMVAISGASGFSGPSIAIDGQGKIHISYTDRYNGDLIYAYYDGTWLKETVDRGTSSSLALDSQGNPHISYTAYWPDDDLKYAYNDGTWHFDTVDSCGYGSLALDCCGNPHIGYYYWTNGDLKYAYKVGTELPVHNLNTEEDFAKIQEAVDDSDTEHGHTITVDPGTYNENVNVTKSLTIRSTSGTPTDTIVQAANSDEHVFNVSVDYVNISGFTVTEASAASAGIYLSNVEHCKISNNQLINNGIGICLVYSSNNIITSNNASNIWQGIWLDSSSNNIVKSNNASFNGQFGIWVTFSRNNTLITNIANSNEGCGIFLDGTSNSTVTANTVNSNKGDGIWLWWYSSNNTITANNISSNNCGIELSCYGNNSLYHNNFMDNVIQASDTTGNNRWNDSYPSGGNYWSDYDDESEGAFDILSGPNQNYLGSDGIADTPYDISGDAGAKDNYPLMEPWGEEEIDQLSPEANLDIILKLASYYDESNDYVSNNWNKAVELYTPALTDKERQDIQNELAKKFPKLDFTAEEIAEEIINFQYYISNIIIEGQTVTFTKTDEGTLVNDNGAERLLENTQIPFKKIELKASLGNCVMTVTSGDTRYSMMLETFCDLGGCGIEVNYDLDVRDVGIGASLTSAIFVGPGLPPIVISPGIYTKLSIDTPDHTITILLNDPFTLKNAEASAGIYIGYDLSGYKGVGGGVGVDAGTFVSLTPTDINPADVTGIAVDVAKTLSGGLSDLGGPQKGDPVKVAVGTGLDVIEKVTSSLPPSAKAGVELGAEGKLGLGLGAKVGGGGAKASVDGLGAVSSSTTMPLNIFGAVIPPNKEELTTFYVSSIKAFPIIVEVYDVSQHPDIIRLLDACGKLPNLAGYLWTAFNSAKEIDVSEDHSESVKVSLDFGAGIGGEIVSGIFEAEGKGQYSVGFETNLKTLIAAFTLDTSTLWDRGYFGGMITQGTEVSGGAGAVGGPGVDVKAGISKEITKISVQGKEGGGGGAGSLALSVSSLKEQSDVDVSVNSDYGVDTNGDGLFDYLAVDVGLNVRTPDNYSVGGMLFKNWTCVGFTLNSTYLDAGLHSITLKFDGIHLRNHKINGSYDFGAVLGREGKNDTLFISFSLYNTSCYNYTDFQKSYLNITNLSYSGIDINGNGLYDYLNVDIDLNSMDEGKANTLGILMGENLVLENETSLNISAGISTLKLLFDGKELRSGGSNTYNLTIIVYNEKGVFLDSVNCNVVVPYLNFELPNATLSDFYADRAIDADDDGLYDYVAVDVGVNVSVPGNYTVDAYLRGNKTTFYIYNSTFLESDGTVILVVDGLSLRNTLKNQNYSLVNVRLYQNNTLLAVRKKPYNTSIYNYSSFNPPEATLTDNYSDQCVDIDSDGLYNYLGIDVGLNVTKPDVYKISGFLKCNQSYISAEKQISLEAGDHTVTLHFDGEAIYSKGYSGKYQLEGVGIIRNGEYIDYMSRTYNTSVYNYTDFEKVNKPPIASFTYSPENPVVNQTITFNASSSSDLDGYILKYEWDFGDGSTGTGKIITHSYSSAGNYDVTLTVTDNTGLKASVEKTITVYKSHIPVNLLVNPGFEQGLGHWNSTGGSANYIWDNMGGDYCIKGIETTKWNLGRLYQDVTEKIEAGERYKIGGWLKTENVEGSVVIGLNYVLPSGWTPADGYVKEIGHVRGTTDWTYYESEWFTLPPMPEDGVAAWFLFDFNNGKGTAYWDDVSLHAEDTAEYYVENYGPLRIATTKEPAYSGDHFYTADTLQTPDNPSSGTMLKALIWPPLGKSISSPITKVRVGTYIECIDGDYNSQSLEYRLYAYNIETGEITRKIHDDTWPPTGNTPTYFPLSYGLKTYDDMIICDTKKSALDEKETLILLSICHHFGAKSHHTKYAAHFDTKDYPAYMEVFTSDGKSTKYYIHDSFTTPTVETITIDQILKDAKLIEKVQTDSPVNLRAIIDNGDFTATIQGDYAIWEKPLTTYNIVDSERYFTYPTEVTLRFAINTDGDFYVGAIGPESECLSVLAMRGWDSGIRILEKPYKGAYLDLDLKQNLLARSLWDEYSAFSEEILSEKNDLRTFYNLPFSLFSNYEKSVFVIAAPIISGDGHYNKEYYQEISDKWCPFSNYDETGEAKRTFKLRYSGEKYSFVNGYAACDNGNIAYIKTDGETLAYRNRYWVTNKYSTDVYPKSVEVGFGITWSIARPTVGIAVVADNVQIIEHSEWAKGVKNPSDSLDGNPSPVMMVLEQGWNMPTTITNAIAPTISNVKVSPTYALPGDSINISADVFDSSGIRWVRALISKGGEYIVTLFMSDPIEMHL